MQINNIVLHEKRYNSLKKIYRFFVFFIKFYSKERFLPTNCLVPKKTDTYPRNYN